ncbi:MAG: dihydroorotase [Gammaproteobacteria bacterium]
MEKLTITRPDDYHVHARSGIMLQTVIPHSARQFARAIIMPNLKQPITTVESALLYRKEILRAIPAEASFTPLMTLYLTPSTGVAEVRKAAACEHVHAFKLYPAGATTNSDAGIASLETIYPILEALQTHDMPLLVHGEVTDPDCDIFDRERLFIDKHLNAIVRRFPDLRIVFEHATTREAVQFVEAANDKIAATITPQHLLYNRNAILAGGIRPHFYCLPLLKRENHRQALLAAATGGNRKFFLGSDSAPHLQTAKETGCGCAGCYSAHAALELYAEAFDAVGKLDKLEAFASFHGADFYRLPRNSGLITLQRKAWTVPASYMIGGDALIPLKAGETLDWKMCE